MMNYTNTEDNNEQKDTNKLDDLIRFLCRKTLYFNTDVLRLCAEVKGVKLTENKSDLARALRSAASRKICRKLDLYKKSTLKSSNNIPRAQWCGYYDDIKIEK